MTDAKLPLSAEEIEKFYAAPQPDECKDNIMQQSSGALCSVGGSILPPIWRRSSGGFSKIFVFLHFRLKIPDVFLQVASFGFLAEGPKFRDPHGRNLLYPRKCSFIFEKSLMGRNPICGKMDIHTPLNITLHAAVHGAGQGHREVARLLRQCARFRAAHAPGLPRLGLLLRSADQRVFCRSCSAKKDLFSTTKHLFLAHQRLPFWAHFY